MWMERKKERKKCRLTWAAPFSTSFMAKSFAKKQIYDWLTVNLRSDVFKSHFKQFLGISRWELPLSNDDGSQIWSIELHKKKDQRRASPSYIIGIPLENSNDSLPVVVLGTRTTFFYLKRFYFTHTQHLWFTKTIRNLVQPTNLNVLSLSCMLLHSLVAHATRTIQSIWPHKKSTFDQKTLGAD